MIHFAYQHEHIIDRSFYSRQSDGVGIKPRLALSNRVALPLVPDAGFERDPQRESPG